jgi:mono/diheme cytochrome c family protein
MRQAAQRRAILFVLISMLTGSVHAGGDPVRGAELFRQNCAPCHSVEPGKNLVRLCFRSLAALPLATQISCTRPR